jgi:DNA-binding transcriptional ArsR family regulator
MLDVDVIEDPAAAAAALDPIKSRLLSELSEPGSAASLAARVGMARQKVNYHLRGLEAHKLVRVAEDRRWGGLTEHLYVATATSYVVSPAALGPVAANPTRATDRLSASYLIALAARVVHEVAGLWRRAVRAEKRLATFSIDTDIRFASTTDRAAFTSELTRAISALAARYHDASAPDGRTHRLVVMAYPKPHRQV